jgi:hypothetical protein
VDGIVRIHCPINQNGCLLPVAEETLTPLTIPDGHCIGDGHDCSKHWVEIVQFIELSFTPSVFTIAATEK